MKKTRILFVEDDPDFASANKSVLEQAGYEVIVATTGKDGLEMARREKPDLIILDVMLPDINGFSVCRELKDDPKYSVIPIVLLTAVGVPRGAYTENIAKEHKADAFLTKPMERAKMIETIGNLLSKTMPAAKEEMTRPKILLIDDDPDFLDATKQILIANRYDVITATNGEEGIAKAKYENPDLIILDVIMPGKDGYTVCYELRKLSQTRPIPIIMLTAIGQQLAKPEYGMDIAIDHLADDYIDKPVETQTLLKKIEKHLTFYSG